MTFAQRQITISIALAQNTQTNQPSTFAESGTSNVNVTGLRTSVRIRNAGSPINSATVKIWGLTPSLMNQLSTLGFVLNIVPLNIMTISAGDVGGQQSIIFRGTILAAYGDYSNQPDVPMIFECLPNAQTTAVQPTSYPQAFDVATAFSSIAALMSAQFVNNGVNVKMRPMYLSGSPTQQADKLARAANVNWGLPNGSTLEIWPKNGSRNNQTVPKINVQTGMIGYPAFTQQGIIVKTLFNPQIAFGSMVEVDSSVLSSISQTQASKGNSFPTQWAVNKLDLDLDAYLPKGQWMSTIYAYSPGKSNITIPPP